jgi:tetratricopeptide (TPR) repeat protein
MGLMLNKKVLFLGVVTLFFASSCNKEKKQNDILEKNVPDVLFGSSKDQRFKTFEQLSDAAQSLYQERQFKSLIELVAQYQDEYQTSPQKDYLVLFKAMGLTGSHQLKEASDLLNSLLSYPNKDIRGKAYFYLGDVKRLSSLNQEALKDYFKAYEILKLPEIYSSIADTYVRMKDFDKAATYYKRVLSYTPHSAKDRFYLSVIQFNQNKLKESKGNLDAVIKDNPHSREAYHYLALIAQKDKNMVDYYYYMSRAALLKRDYQAVVDLLENKVEITKDSRLFEIMITSFIHLGKFDDAVRIYKTGEEKKLTFMKDVTILIYKGILVVNKTQGLHAATAYFKDLYKRYPNHFDVIVTYAGYLYKENKKNVQVAKLYRKALALEPENTEYHYKLALWYEENGNSTLAQLYYGILYYYQNQKDLALEAFEHLINDQNFKSKELYYYMAKIYKEQNDTQNASKYNKLYKQFK